MIKDHPNEIQYYYSIIIFYLIFPMGLYLGKSIRMIDEVKGLINRGVTHEKLQYYGLEYKFISSYLLNEISKEELFEKLNIAIHQFAKRQATWFRRMEKQGFDINWIDGNLPLGEQLNRIEELLKK